MVLAPLCFDRMSLYTRYTIITITLGSFVTDLAMTIKYQAAVVLEPINNYKIFTWITS